MTHDEATAALAADPAALVWAGRDFDALAAMLEGYEGKQLVAAARAAIANARDMPARLVAVSDGIAAAKARLAEQEKQRADAERYIIESRRAALQAENAQHQAERRRHLTYGATHPAFQALRARIDAAQAAVTDATSSDDIDRAIAALGADFRTSANTLRDVGASLFKKAA